MGVLVFEKCFNFYTIQSCNLKNLIPGFFELCTGSSERSYEQNLIYDSKKYFRKSFSFSKVNFSLLEKKILRKKVDFFTIFVHMNVQNFRHIFEL